MWTRLFILSVLHLTLIVEDALCSQHIRYMYNNRWLVQIDSNKPEEVTKIAVKHGFQNHGQIFDNFYLFQHHHVSKRSLEAKEHLSSGLQTETKVLWAEQQVIQHRELKSANTSSSFPADPLWDEQWYMQDDEEFGLNVTHAWKTSTGRGVIVAVVDEGVSNHIDLNIDGTTSNNVASNSHGTKAAGVIAAKRNNVCGVGFAYDASIADYRLFDGQDIDDAREVEILTRNAGTVNVYSNSWGASDTGAGMGGDSFPVQSALKSGSKNGSIYVWAVGNGADNGDSCAYEGHVNSVHVIGITGVTRFGSLFSSAEKCSAVMATTMTKDNVRDNNPIISLHGTTKCSRDFSLSSAAAPMASGIVALALQYRTSQWTWRDIQHMITLSSLPSLSLTPYDFKMNSAGYKVSESYGFGLMNAGRIVEFARKWKVVPDAEEPCIVHFPQTNVSLPDGKKLSVYINKSDCNIRFLEHVVVKSDFTYSMRGGIKLILRHKLPSTSGTGTESVILPGRRYDVFIKRYNSFAKSFQYWGEDSVGMWELEFENVVPLMYGGVGAGTLYNATVILHGMQRSDETVQGVKRNTAFPSHSIHIPPFIKNALYGSSSKKVASGNKILLVLLMYSYAGINAI